MRNLEEIKNAIIVSGSITATDVYNLREIVYTDGKVEKTEAEFLFKLRKELNDLGNLKAWDDFFVQAVCDYILANSIHGTISDADTQWLTKQISENHIIDDVERKLLNKLRREIPNFPPCLLYLLNHTSSSFVRSLGRKVFLQLCKNSKTMRSMEYGVSKIGNRKMSIQRFIDK